MNKETEPKAVQLSLVPDLEAPAPPPIYANYVQLTFTPEDFTMHLSWYTTPPLGAPPQDDIIEARIQPVARVVLPLNLMRNIIALLQRQLEAYEESFGAISEHPNKPAWLRETENSE